MGYLCRLLKHKELGLQFLSNTLHRNTRDIDSITPSYRWGNWSLVPSLMELPWWLSGKESACQCRRSRFDPWVGKIPWKGNGNPLQYSFLENPQTEERGGLQSMGSQRVRHDWATKQARQVALTRVNPATIRVRNSFAPCPAVKLNNVGQWEQQHRGLQGRLDLKDPFNISTPF